VFTGTMSLTSGLAMAATCMSRPHLISHDAGTLFHAVFFASVCHCVSSYHLPFLFACVCVCLGWFLSAISRLLNHCINFSYLVCLFRNNACPLVYDKSQFFIQLQFVLTCGHAVSTPSTYDPFKIF